MKDFTHPLFDEIIFKNKTGSTNKLAEKLIKNKEVAGNILCIARTQTGGLGRKHNVWFSPEGGIWMSAGIYGLSVESSLTIFTGICIHKALIELFPQISNDLKIKWPNDIYLNDKKLCGVLTTHLGAHKYHIIGIGINTNFSEFPDELKNTSTATLQYLKNEIDNTLLIQKIFDIFAANLPDFIEYKLDVSYFNKHSLLKGKNAELDTDFDKFTGLVKGINKTGALLMELKSGMIQPFYAGTVSRF